MELQAPLGQWLNEVKGQELVAGIPDEDASLRNMLTFPLSDARAAGITVAAMCAFIVAAFREFWTKAERAGVSGIFYTWVDEMAGQIRCSFVNGADLDQLPFACPVRVVTSPDVVGAAALESQLGNEISSLELEKVEWSDPDEDASKYILDVYARTINVVR